MMASATVSPFARLLDLDAKVCYCFHVSRRKLVNFVRLYQPKVPSQLSQCGGGGPAAAGASRSSNRFSSTAPIAVRPTWKN